VVGSLLLLSVQELIHSGVFLLEPLQGCWITELRSTRLASEGFVQQALTSTLYVLLDITLVALGGFNRLQIRFQVVAEPRNSLVKAVCDVATSWQPEELAWPDVPRFGQ